MVRDGAAAVAGDSQYDAVLSRGTWIVEATRTRPDYIRYLCKRFANAG
jgi:hypothetical protein